MARIAIRSFCANVASASRRWFLIMGGMPMLLFGLANADVMNLKDGSKVEGKVRRDGDGWVVIENGHLTHVDEDQVESIELIPTTNPLPVVAQVRLNSLRHSLENISDLKEIISRVQRFVDSGEADSPTTVEAKKDLAVWKDRLDRQMVKVGLSWVLPTERDRLVFQAQAAIDTARQLMKQGRTKEAEALLMDALNVDPTNPAGNFLVGLLRAQQDQLPAARKAFEAVDVATPNHGPTLNNLAIVQWRQGQFAAAMNSFDGAMEALPVNRLILENVSAAIESLPLWFQNAPVAAKAIRHFHEQEKLLADRMAKQGLHRFGSVWVTDKDVQRMKADEKQTLDRLDQLSGDFDRTKQRVNELNQRIADGQAQMHQIEASGSFSGSGIGVVEAGYPPVYFNLSSDVARMRSEKSDLVGKLDSLKNQANELEAGRASNKNRGVQIMFGPEAAPIRIAVLPGK